MDDHYTITTPNSAHQSAGLTPTTDLLLQLLNLDPKQYGITLLNQLHGLKPGGTLSIYPAKVTRH